MGRRKSKLNKYAGLAIGFALASSVIGGPQLVHYAHVRAAANANERLANHMAAARGWGPDQQQCLDWLWQRESGFSQYADTRITHAGGDGPGSAVFAYGIAQARPASKYPKAGQPADMGGSSNPEAQVGWGLSYLYAVYRDPCGGWAHEQADGWY
jgi:hypothetical protein